MIQEMHRVLKNNRRKNERNIHAIRKQTMRHTGYHPTGCGATADFGPTKYRYTLMAIKNHRVLKKQKQRDVIQGRRMIQEIHRVLKNNRRKNERNKYMQSRNKQCAIRAITPLAVEQPQTLDLLSTATH